MIDFVVLLIVALAAWSGWRVGGAAIALRLAGLLLGLLAGLRVAGMLSSSLSAVAHVVLGAACAIGGVFIGGAIGRHLGTKLALGLRRAHVGILDGALGAAAKGVVALVACWLLAALVLAAGPTRWASPVRASLLVGQGGTSAPLVGRAVEGLSVALRTAAPQDVASLVPVRGTARPTPGTLSRVDAAVAGSVFVVAADGCSGGVVGTGFVAARGLVVTNAHVVRGTSVAVIHTQRGDLTATVVGLNRRADLAVLRVPNLAATPLPLAGQDAVNGTPAVLVGYPAGGPRTAVGAVVLQRLPVPDPGFSDGVTFHQAYRIEAPVRHGDSGSPLLDTSGHVIGVVNAVSGTGSEGYAITIDELLPDLSTAAAARGPAPAASCS